ncbi:MAG: alpha/beta hydrolase [Flavobacteriales bacterium]|nr:alpha/beta hydrolase [Flavobacteriales bacterium]
MKHFTLIFFIGFSFGLQGQTRYYDTPFAVFTQYNIEYGRSDMGKGKMEALHMDIYQPTNDTLLVRPLIVLAHGGGFIFGNKNNYPIETLCTRLAQMGYVTVSIDYRKGFGKKEAPEIEAKKTVEKAIDDMKMSVEFLINSTRTGNPYKIDSNLIIIGGSSAGGIMGLNAAYGNFGRKIPPVQGVLSLSGAIGDTSFITRPIPCFLAHGSADPMVPYGDSKARFQIPLLFKAPPIQIQGSSIVAQKLQKEGYPFYFHTFKNQGHAPYDKVLERKLYPANMDITINHLRNFLYNTYWNFGAKKIDIETGHTNEIYLERQGPDWHIYPVDKTIKKVEIIVETLERKKVLKKKVKKKLKTFNTEIKLPTGKYRATLVYNNFRKPFYFDIP